jgi:hypothetical protein
MRKPVTPRLPRLTRARTLAFTALTLTAAAGAFIAVAATPASADTTITATYPVTGSTFIKSLDTTVALGPGTLASTLDLTTSAVSGTLSLPAATASFKEFGFIPVTATEELIQDGSATGTASLTDNTVSVTSTSTLKITSLSVAGLKIPVGSDCESAPTTISLSSQSGFTLLGGGNLAGTYTIPRFSHCGLATFLINLTIPGSGNTITLTLGAATLS